VVVVPGSPVVVVVDSPGRVELVELDVVDDDVVVEEPSGSVDEVELVDVESGTVDDVVDVELVDEVDVDDVDDVDVELVDEVEVELVDDDVVEDVLVVVAFGSGSTVIVTAAVTLLCGTFPSFTA
jgi:hypothetical protein